MAEIGKVESNRLRAISLFSGCGGSSLGYRMAGLAVVWANEFIPAARQTYLANFPKAAVDARDIRKIKPAEVLKAIGMKAGELDLVDGSPPCASFSTAGNCACADMNAANGVNLDDVEVFVNDLLAGDSCS